MASRPVTFSGITPNLVYHQVDEAVRWLVNVLGFTERARYVDEQGVVRQAEMLVGSQEVWISSQEGGYKGIPQYVVVWVDDVDAQNRYIKARGIDVDEPRNQSWGVRSFYIADPGGYHWGFHKRLSSGYEQTKPFSRGGLRQILATQI